MCEEVLFEEMFIIYLFDNGSYWSDWVGELRGIKGFNYEGGICVLGIFCWFDYIVFGLVISEFVGLVDIVLMFCGFFNLMLFRVILDGVDIFDFLIGWEELIMCI